jgi:hypothetical protein
LNCKKMASNYCHHLVMSYDVQFSDKLQGQKKIVAKWTQQLYQPRWDLHRLGFFPFFFATPSPTSHGLVLTHLKFQTFVHVACFLAFVELLHHHHYWTLIFLPCVSLGTFEEREAFILIILFKCLDRFGLCGLFLFFCPNLFNATMLQCFCKTMEPTT